MSLRVLFCLLFFALNTVVAQSPSPSPNILLIISDDQRYDQLDPFMPNVRARIFNEGIEFTKAYVTTPACCPSRSTIFTGLYASHHKVLGNGFKLNKETIFEYLQGTYYQGIIGKYLNSWSGERRPEFDYWAVFKGGSTPYFDPVFNINGIWTTTEGHINPVISSFALDFINQAKDSGKPFFLTLTYNSPHDPATPEEADIGLFEHLPFEFSQSFNLFERTKPLWIRDKKEFSQRKADHLVKKLNRRRECIFSMDRSIGSILDRLEEENLIENTLIFFISDNGLNYGEHRLLSKNVAYEPSVHVPFAIRFDEGNLLKRTTDALVANVDITPTILSVINNPMDRKFDGKDLSLLFQEELPVRQELFLEEWRGFSTINTSKEMVRRPFRAIHNGRYVLIKTYPMYDKYSLEFYDLEKDPEQINNIFYNRKKRSLKRNWLKRIERKELQAANIRR